MDPNKIQVLTKLLNAFLFNFTNSMGFLTPKAWMVLGFFFGIELSFVGLRALYDNEFNPRPMVEKFIVVIFLSFAILNWPGINKGLASLFVNWGLQAANSGMVEKDFTDPDNIARYGFAATGVIFQHLSQYSGWEQIKNFFEIWTSGAAAFITILFYFGMAAWVFVSLLEFYYGAVFTIILIPWGLSGVFAWVGEKAIGYMVAAAVRLFVLAFLLAIALPVMITIQATIPDNTVLFPLLLGKGFFRALYGLLGAFGLFMLCLRTGVFSLGLMWGGPQLTMQDAASAISTLGNHATRLGTAVDALTTKIEQLGGGGGNTNSSAGSGATPGRRP